VLQVLEKRSEVHWNDSQLVQIFKVKNPVSVMQPFNLYKKGKKKKLE
jgi:hypothetical protein